jgi:anti-sigma-K factor RskA
VSDSPAVTMTHDDAFAELGALALGALRPAEARAVLSHVDGCAECAAELASMREAVAGLPDIDTLERMPADRSASIRETLVARAAASQAPVRSSDNYWRPLAVAASIAIVALGLGYYRKDAETKRLAAVVAEREAARDSLAGAVRARDEVIAAITGPRVNVVELSSDAIQSPTARMFWDRATNRWTMYAHGLPALKPGRAYELWLITADAKIPAGTFKPSPDGTATFAATYALEPSQLQAIAVTEEPEAGVPAPTGPIILIGAAAPK